MSLFNSPSVFNIKASDDAATLDEKMPLKGWFQNGKWMCDCDPRLPAASFETKKEGKNKGKWFYTCQKQKAQGGCGFFLWREWASRREKNALLSNNHTEPEPPRQPPTKGRKKASLSSAKEGKDWIQSLGAKNDSDEYGFSENDERDLLNIGELVNANSRASSPAPCIPEPETPQKVTQTDAPLTPGSKRKREEDNLLPTPQTGAVSPFKKPAVVTPRGGMFDGNETLGLQSPSVTPTPARFRNAVESNVLAEPSLDITQDVLKLLKTQGVPASVESKLKELLSKHDMRVSGIVKGRDASRLVIHNRDKTIAELKQRINQLEVEREMDKVVIRHLNQSIADSMRTK